VIRTVGSYEAAGVAGIHIEDQVAPKKCGHLEGKLVIPAEEMAAKVRAAVEARAQPEFVIIARTDARAVEGLERSLQRGRMYLEAGADVLFIEALTSEAEAEEAARAFPGVPLLSTGRKGVRPRRSAWTACRSWDTGSLSSPSARCWRQPGPCGGHYSQDMEVAQAGLSALGSF
jgi:2-methylisocitrate lyase-like PEP mutase family enzyme